MKPLCRLLICLVSFLACLSAVSTGNSKPQSPAARAYDTLYTQFLRLRPDEMKAASVKDLTLERDVGRFLLEDGVLYLCTPVAHRVCAAVFRGKGVFRMMPPTEIERQQLNRFFETDSVSQEFTQLFLLFADTTAEELSRRLPFGRGVDPLDASDFIKSALAYLSDDDKKYFNTDFMFTFLQKEQSDLFFAHFAESKSKPFFFEVDPFNEEEVSFGRRNTDAPHYAYETVNQFHTHQEYSRRIDERRGQKDRIAVSGCTIEATINDDLDFSASAMIRFRTLFGDQGWLRFDLYSRLEVDSVFWRPGVKADFHKGEDQSTLWVPCEPGLAGGQLCSLQVFYHGDLLFKDELAWITIKAPSTWYPRYNFRTNVKYDLTFHTPTKLKFASVGEKVLLIEGEETSTSRWITRAPTHNASFNIGYFKESEIKDERIPPVTVFMAETGHRQIGAALMEQGVLSGRNMEEQVGGDIANSMSFFQNVYGKCIVDRLYATEIPLRHGEAFPGLIHLSWTTYQRTSQSGYDEVFRAHEVAHQWWGIGVDFATYHDQWLSEGFSEYSGLWYMQTILRDNKKFFSVLESYKEQILKNRHYLFGKGQEAGPISLGYRTHSSSTSGDYDLIIYKKGAWVLHMLRNMLIDLKTMNEDRFKNMMREFYASYLGAQASTVDFQRIVSKHVGEEMGWFFSQWVNDTRIPEYQFAYRVSAADAGRFRVTCRIEQHNVPENFKMYVPLLILFEGDKFVRLRVLVTGRKAEFDLPLMPMSPEKIIFNDLNSVLCEVDNVSWD